MWHFTTDRINWQPGTKGKGYILDDGSVVEWTTDSNGDPHHKEEWDLTGSKSAMTFLYYLDPDGGIHNGGLGYQNATDKSDEECIVYITNADPRTYDASSQEPAFDDDLVDSIYGQNPQSEFDGRDDEFGHAHNLMDILSGSEDSLQELKNWLESFNDDNEAQALSPHHEDALDMLPKPSVSPSNAPAVSPPGHESEYEKLLQKGAGDWGRDDGWNPTPSWWESTPESWTKIDPWTEPEWDTGPKVLPVHRCPQCTSKNHTATTPYTCNDCGHVWLDKVLSKTAHNLQWMAGQEGKGVLLNDGRMLTWNTDTYGTPEHLEMAEQAGVPAMHHTFIQEHTPFVISPEGQIQHSWRPDGHIEPDRLRMIRAIDRGLRPSRIGSVEMPDPPKEIWPDLYGSDQPRCSLCGGQADKPGPCPTCKSMMEGTKTGGAHEWISNYTSL